MECYCKELQEQNLSELEILASFNTQPSQPYLLQAWDMYEICSNRVKMQEEGIPPREATWIGEDSEEERDDETLNEGVEEHPEDALGTMWTEKEELWCEISKRLCPTIRETWLAVKMETTALL